MALQTEQQLKKEIVEASRRSGAQGWCPGTVGNISALNPQLGRIYIKRSKADLSRLETDDLLTLDVNGNILAGNGKPSIETSLHLGIYKTVKHARAIFHLHPPFATAYAVAGKKIPIVTEAAKIVLADVPLVPRAPPGSNQLATNTQRAFNDPTVKAALLRDHGLVAVGETLDDAYNTTAIVEDTAKVAFLSSLLKIPRL